MTTEITAELNELRSQVRTLKRMLFGVFGVVVVGGLLAATSLQSVPDVVRAKKFEVVNAEGKVVAEVKRFLGGGGIFLSNKEGNQIAAIAPIPILGGGMLTINDKDGEGAVTIASSADGGGGLEVMAKGEPVGGLFAISGSGLLALSSKEGNPTVVLTDNNGNGILRTYDSKGQETSKTP